MFKRTVFLLVLGIVFLVGPSVMADAGDAGETMVEPDIDP